MRSLIRWLFPPRSLEAIEGPTRVRVDGTLLGEDSFESPMTGRRALIFQYGFWDRSPARGSKSGERYRRTLLAMGRVGGDLRVDVHGATLLVPLSERVGLELLGGYDPVPALQAVPSELYVANPSIREFEDELCYDELALHPGQAVRVHGVVEPVEGQRAMGAFRGGGGADWDFVARPDIGRFRIEELR